MTRRVAARFRRFMRRYLKRDADRMRAAGIAPTEWAAMTGRQRRAAARRRRRETRASQS